jgi:peptide/nickel transport system permease protein
MYAYILKRLALTVPVLLGIATIVFVLMFAIPGDPVRLLMGQHGNPETEAMIRQELGLDKPFHVQYVRFLARLLRGDLGTSYRQHREVKAVLFERLPATLKLGMAALGLAVLFGITAGILAALNRNTPVDGAVMVASLIGISTPVFWLGLMLMLVFAARLRWLPVAGYGSGGDLRHLALPAISLSMVYIGYIARMTRSSLLEVIGTEFLRTARAKGLGPRVAAIKHGLKNALIPIVTVIGLNFAGLLGGAVATETVFAWPGIGRAMVDAIRMRDLPVIEGGVILLSLSFVLINLLVDVSYCAIDPRVKLEG